MTKYKSTHNNAKLLIPYKKNLNFQQKKKRVIYLLLLPIILYQLSQYFKGTMYTGTKPQLSGRIAVVTGGANGIGKQIVRDLAEQGCYVIIADRTNAEQLVHEINSKYPSPKVEYKYIELGDFQSIDNFVEGLNKQHIKKLDFLINNAGVLGPHEIRFTKSQKQMHFGVNYLGHFYLTHLLWRFLENSEYFRVVMTSSITHRKVLGFGQDVILQFDSFNFEKGGYDRDLAYSRSKLCLTMFAKALSEMVPKEKGLIVSVHPGVVFTDMIRNMFTGIFGQLIAIIINIFSMIFMKNTQEGAQTTLFVLYTQQQYIESGAFYSDCEKAEYNLFVGGNYQKLFEMTQTELKIVFGQQ